MFIVMILLMYTVANASQFYLDLVNSMFSNSLHIFVQMDISVYHQLYAIYLDELCVHQQLSCCLFRWTIVHHQPVYCFHVNVRHVHHQFLCCFLQMNFMFIISFYAAFSYVLCVHQQLYAVCSDELYVHH